MQSIQAIGYKELYDYFDGLITQEEAIEQLKQNSRRYAKRQFTWFRNKTNTTWFDVFELYHDGKQMLHTIGNGDMKQVIAAIYGRNMAKSMLEIKGETLDYQVAQELEITLTGRGKGEDRIPMCGVPHHSADSYMTSAYGFNLWDS